MKRGIDVRAIEKRERWVSALRGQLLAHGIRSPELVEEHRFLPDRMFRFDFAIPTLRIGIEVEGGVYARAGGELGVVGGKLVSRPGQKSRHTTGAGYARDCEKYNLAAIAGWKVLRFTSTMITTGQAAAQVNDLVRQLRAERWE